MPVFLPNVANFSQKDFERDFDSFECARMPTDFA